MRGQDGVRAGSGRGQDGVRAGTGRGEGGDRAGSGRGLSDGTLVLNACRKHSRCVPPSSINGIKLASFVPGIVL